MRQRYAPTQLSISFLVLAFASSWVCWVPVAAADRPQVVALWPGNVPDESAPVGAEVVRLSPRLDRKQVEVTEPTRLVTNVSKPTLTIYRPSKEKDTGRAPKFPKVKSRAYLPS